MSEPIEYIYVYKTDIEGEIKAVQRLFSERSKVEKLIRENKDPWFILDAGVGKSLAAFCVDQKEKMNRRFNLDDLVERLNAMESEIYDFRRFVEDESKRIKEETK
jgi:replication-associated recombination protein RarA